jgi:acyl-CoA dehydrogenase
LILKDCAVTMENILGQVGGGLHLGRRWFAGKAVKVGARYVGMADCLLQMAATYARDWATFGRPLAERPAVQRILAEMAARVDAARWMVYRGAWMVDQGQPTNDDILKVRVFTWDVLQQAIDGTIQVYGGPHYAAELPMLRIYQGLIEYETMEHGLDRLRYALSVRVLDLAA